MTAQATQAGCPHGRQGVPTAGRASPLQAGRPHGRQSVPTAGRVEHQEAKLRRMLISENLRAGRRPVLMLRLLIEKLRPRAKM